MRLRLVCATAFLFVFVSVSRAASYSVDSTADTIDGTDGVTTLREALLAATAPFDVISLFPIAGQTISVISQLPPLQAEVILFGNFATLDGAGAGAGADGLQLMGGADVNRLRIINFDGNGISATGCIGVRDASIGVDGGGNPAGNGGHGILINVPCGLDQTFITDSTIGSNGGDGVRLDSANRASFDGCFIGTTSSGLDRGNGGAGIRIMNGGNENFVAVTTPNVIAFNDGAGIAVTEAASDHNRFRRNRVFDNGGLAIDLGNDGVTANDAAICDPDAGPNAVINFPVLQSAFLDDNGATVVSGVMDGPSFATLDLDFFETSGIGEADSFIGSGAVSLDASCAASFAISLPALPIGTAITASASTSTRTSELWPSSVTVIGGPEVSTFAFGPAVMRTGDVSTVTVTITNPRPVALTGVGLTNNLPAGVTAVAMPASTECTTGTLTRSGNVVTLSGGTIDAGSACTFTFDVTAAAPGSFLNVIAPGDVTATGAIPNSIQRVATLDVFPRPSVTKSFAAPAMHIGDTNRLHIDIVNTESGDSGDVDLTDDYPAGLVNASPSNAAWVCANPAVGALVANPGGTRVQLSDATVPAMTTCRLSVDVTATASGTLTNTIPVTNATFDGFPADAPASASVTVSAPPTATKSFTPAVIARNATSTLTIVVSNPESAPVTGVTVTDAYPTGMINVTPPSGTSTCGTLTLGAADLAVTGGTIPPNGTCTITAVVTVEADAPSTLVNTLEPAGVSTLESGAMQSPAVATLDVNDSLEVANLSVSVPTIVPGDATTVAFDIMNPNARAVTGVAFSHTFGAGVTGVNPGAASTSGCDGVIPVVTANGVSFSGATISGTACRVTFDVTSTVVGPHTETIAAGAITSDVTDPNETSASVTFNVASPPASTATFDPLVVRTGLTATLELLIFNPNDIALSGVAFQTTLPAGLVLADPIFTNCGTLTAGTGTSTIELTSGTIGPTANCIVAVGVTGQASGSYPFATGPMASNAGANTDGATASLLVLDPPSITKAFDPPSIAFAETSELTVTLTNPNADAITGVAFTDDYPAGVANAGLATTTCPAGSPATLSSPERLEFTGGTIPAASSCTVTVLVRGVSSGTKNNFISPGTTSSVVGPTEDFAIGSLTVGSAPQLGLALAFDPPTVLPNETSRLTIVVSNPNDLPLGGLRVTDRLPPTLSVAAVPNATSTCGGTLSAAPGATIISLTGGALAANGACTIAVDILATVPGHWVNTTGSTDVATTMPPTFAGIASATLDVMEAISVIKGFNNAVVSAGTEFSLGVNVLNPNFVPVTGLAFEDVYPAGLVNSAVPLFQNSCGGTVTADAGAGSFSLSGGIVPGGQICSVTIVVRATTPGTYTNTIGANAVTTANAPSNVAASSATVTVSPLLPPLATLHSPDPIASFDEPASVMLRIDNPNAIALANVGANLAYPAPFVNAIDATSTCGGTLTASAGTGLLALSGGAVPPFGFCTISLRLAAPVGGSQTLLLPAGAVTSEAGSSAASSSLELLMFDRPQVASQFIPAVIRAAGAAELQVTFTNVNAHPIDVALEGLLPADLLVAPGGVLSNTCGGTAYAEPSTPFFGLSNSLVAGGRDCTIAVSVTTNIAGTYVNTILPVQVYSAVAGQPSAPASATLTVSPVAGPVATVQSSDPVASFDDPVQVLLRIDNPNLLPLTNLGATLIYPTPFVNAADGSTTCGGTLTAAAGSGALSLSGGSIPASGFCTISLSLTAPVASEQLLVLPAGAVTSDAGANVEPSSIGLLMLDRPQVQSHFLPALIGAGGATELHVILTNPNAYAIDIAFDGVLPAGLIIGGGGVSTNTCGGTAYGDANTTAFGLSNGVIAAGEDCTMVVPVTATDVGTYVSTILPDQVSSVFAGHPAAPASATLTVSPAAGPVATLQSSDSVASFDDPVQVLLRIDNPNLIALTNLGATLVYPTPFVNAADGSTTCGGTLTAAAGSGALSLSGASIPASGFCTISLSLTAPVASEQLLVLPAGAVTSDAGANVEPSSIGLLMLDRPQVQSHFVPALIGAGGASELHVTLSNVNAYAIDIAFDGVLPAGLIIGGGGVSTNRCGGTAYGDANAPAFGLSNGVIAAGEDCTMVVPVTATDVGTYVSTILPDQVSSALAGHPSDATSATLEVIVADKPHVTLAFAPQQIGLTDHATLTITIANPAVVPIDVAFDAPYPLGLVNATPSQTSSTCGGVVSAIAGGSSIALAGGIVPANGECVVTVMVGVQQLGSYVLELDAASLVSAAAGNAAADASATLIVQAHADVPAASDAALMALAFLLSLAALKVLRR